MEGAASAGLGNHPNAPRLFLLPGGRPPGYVFSPVLLVLLMPSFQPGWDLSLVSFFPKQTLGLFSSLN